MRLSDRIRMARAVRRAHPPLQAHLLCVPLPAELLGGGGGMMPVYEHTRIFRGQGYTVKAHPRSGFFCQHMTDIFYDYTHGPYMFVCNCRVEVDIEMCMTGECPDFVEEVADHGP